MNIKKRLDILIKNAAIYTMDSENSILHGGMIGIADSKILFIEKMGSVEEYEILTEIDAEGKVVFPGFVNTHIHIFQSFLKGLGADHRLIEWLNLSALPYGEVMSARQQFLAAQLACMEAIKSGCTTLAEFFYTSQDEELAHAVISGMQSTGIRSVFIRTFQDTGEEYGMPKCFLEPVSTAMRKVDNLVKQYGRSPEDMLTIWTGPCVTWATTREGYEGMLEYCRSEKMPYSMHINETLVDNEMCERYYGKKAVDLLEEIGFLSEDFLAVHCVNLTENEMDRFKEHDVKVSHNPMANLYLGSGVAPIPELLKKGVVVSLGTDGAASNNSTDMMETLKIASLIQKGYHRDAAIITAGEMLQAVTVGGAKALHKEKTLGTLEVGKKADVIIYNPDQLKSTPMNDVPATLIYSSGHENIETTIVNGKIVYNKGVFEGVDEQSVIAEVKAEAAKLIKSLKL
jgi:5-methylthioadenosine/S-adenosylhomocysteine deaminase